LSKSAIMERDAPSWCDDRHTDVKSVERHEKRIGKGAIVRERERDKRGGKSS